MALKETSTKERLLQIIEDIDIITRELFERLVSSKEKIPYSEQALLLQLLMSKNEEFKEVHDLAMEQGDIEAKMVELAEEVRREDEQLQTLEKSLKEAETLLSTALFQAKQKLDQITRAQEHSVSSDDLVRFAHRISSTNAVAAPLNWTAGDPRRPYPTDFEMRLGFLGKLNDLPPSAQPTVLLDYVNNAGNYPFFMGGAGMGGAGISQTDNPIITSGSYIHPPHFSTALGIDPSTRNHEDVDLMSSDSSSTSSSDSQ